MTRGQYDTNPQDDAQARTTGSAGEQRSVKSAERVFDLLEHVMSQPRGSSFTEILSALDIPKSSLHALLGVLERRGYLETDPASRRIRLGLRTLELGQAYVSGQDLIETAHHALEALVAEVNETAQLAQLAGTENIYLAKVDSSHSLRLQSQPGIRLPAHATGVGKAILSRRAPAEIAALFGTETLPTFGPKTLGTLTALQDELAAIRQRGFAIDNEEYTPGVFCLAVPLVEPGKPVGCGVSVSMPVSRASEPVLAHILSQLARCALDISRRLGNPAPDAALVSLADPQAARAQIAALLKSERYSLGFA